MQNNSINVCRFCLKLVYSANVDVLNVVMREMLSLLLVKLDLDVSENPLVCGICLGVLDEIYLFKSKCLYTEDIISARIETNSKVSLRDILKKIENKSNVHTGENEVVCRLCLEISPNCSYIALGETSEEISLSRDVIQIHLPEMDLNITENPVVCEACHACLKNYVSFARNCMAVEERIKLYCDFQKCSRPVDLACVRQFTEDKAFDLQTKFNKDLAIKQEEGSVKVKLEKVEDAEDYISERLFVDSSSGAQLYLKNEEIYIKSENDEMMSQEMADSLRDEEMGNTVPSGASENSRKKGRTKTSKKGKPEVEMQKCALSPYKTGMLNQQLSQKKSEQMSGQREKFAKFKCEKCPYKTYMKSSLRTHNLIHMDKSEVVMHKCDNCEYETKRKSNIIRHVLQKHRDPKAERRFKCDQCPYEADFKSELRKHNLLHMDKTEVTMHKCDNCEYETRYKSQLIRHMLKHRDPEAERKYKCGKCPYETNFKSALCNHNLIHKDKSEVTMYKCENCEYETKHKSNINHHMGKHRDPRAERKFKCDKCSYETNFKSCLCNHNLIHKDKSEVKMHKCENCEYETRYKRNMTQHMLKHRAPKADGKF